MDWLNIHSSTLDAPEFLCAGEVQQATWLKLLRYCAGQENGGVIAGAKGGTELFWKNVVRVRPAVVRQESRLWQWRGEDLQVWRYPAEREAEIKAKREGGRATVAKRWGHRVAEQGAELQAHRVAEQGAELIRKGMEGERKGMEGEVTTLIPSLEVAQEWCARNGSGYTAEQVRAAYESLQATRHPEGWWQFGRTPVSDWRMGLSSRLERMFAEKNFAGPPAKKVEGAPPPARAGGVNWQEVRG